MCFNAGIPQLILKCKSHNLARSGDLCYGHRNMFFQALGTISGVINVWLTTKQNMWCWPVGLLYIVASYVVFYQARLYAELATHTVYLILTLYGWYWWATQGTVERPFAVSRLKRRDFSIFVLGALILGLLAGEILHRYTDNALPYLDASLAALSFLGMFLQAKKKLESWLLWVVINVVSIAVYLRQGLYAYTLLYAVFLGLAFVGYRSWIAVAQEE